MDVLPWNLDLLSGYARLPLFMELATFLSTVEVPWFERWWSELDLGNIVILKTDWVIY